MGKIIRNGIKYSGTTNSADKINYNNTLSGLEAETAQEAFDELNTKIKNGGSNIKYLTKEQYEALPDSKLTDDVEYRITDANTTNRIDATDVTYGETTVHDAISEVNSDLEAAQNDISTLNNSLTTKIYTNDNALTITYSDIERTAIHAYVHGRMCTINGLIKVPRNVAFETTTTIGKLADNLIPLTNTYAVCGSWGGRRQAHVAITPNGDLLFACSGSESVTGVLDMYFSITYALKVSS